MFQSKFKLKNIVVTRVILTFYTSGAETAHEWGLKIRNENTGIATPVLQWEEAVMHCM